MSPPRPRLRRPRRFGSVEGLEPRLETSARAALAWPVYALIAMLTFPGGPFPTSSGVLGLTVAFLIMVLISLRGSRFEGLRVVRFSVAMLGVGFLGELLAGALSRADAPSALDHLDGIPFAVALWLLAVFIYEVTPVIAAASRLVRPEPASWSLSIVAHAVFVGLALLGYFYGPTARTDGTTWFVSPWIVAATAMILAAARCAPSRSVRVPRPRSSALFGVAMLVLAIGTVLVVRDASILARTVHDLRWGADAAYGGALSFAILGCALSLLATVSLLLRAYRARSAPSGAVSITDEGGLTVQCKGQRDPLYIVIEQGEIPASGTLVTLLGAAYAPPDVGPFRDGAERIAVRQLYDGSPDELARSLRERAAGYLLAASLSALGIFALLHPF